MDYDLNPPQPPVPPSESVKASTFSMNRLFAEVFFEGELTIMR